MLDRGAENGASRDGRARKHAGGDRAWDAADRREAGEGPDGDGEAGVGRKLEGELNLEAVQVELEQGLGLMDVEIASGTTA